MSLRHSLQKKLGIYPNLRKDICRLARGLYPAHFMKFFFFSRRYRKTTILSCNNLFSILFVEYTASTKYLLFTKHFTIGRGSSRLRLSFAPSIRITFFPMGLDFTTVLTVFDYQIDIFTPPQLTLLKIAKFSEIHFLVGWRKVQHSNTL